MEVRFIGKMTGEKHAHPFNSLSIRDSGTGFARKSNIDDGFIWAHRIGTEEYRGNEITNHIGEIKEGDYIKYLELRYDGYRCFAWNPTVTDAYIVNDAGKTIDKL